MPGKWAAKIYYMGAQQLGSHVVLWGACWTRVQNLGFESQHYDLCVLLSPALDPSEAAVESGDLGSSPGSATRRLREIGQLALSL